MNPLIYKIDVKSLQALLQDSRVSEVGIKCLDRFCPYSSRYKSTGSEYPFFFYVGGEINFTPPKGPTIVTKITVPSQIMDMVHKQQDVENVSSISYFTDFLKAGGSEENSGDRYSSTIIGREKIAGVCNMIIRNSWGGCKNKKGIYQYSKDVTKCEEGNLWVPESKLTKHLDGVTYLKLKN